jgi:hypothetical protein
VNPVRKRGPAATARALGKPIPSLGRQRRDLPPELVTAIDLALDPRPERRPGPEELAAVLRGAVRELSDEGALEEDELREPRRRRVPFRARVFAGLCAGALVAAVLVASHAPADQLHPAAAAGAAALAVALLPRLGWIAAVAGLCAWLASPDVGQEGTAAYVVAACLPIPLLLPRSPAWWSVPGFAPLLALAGPGPAYTALAGQAPTWPRRAALGALGSLWIALADDTLADPGPFALTTAAFALAAILLPVLVRGLRLPLDVIAAGVWGGALYAALLGIERVAGPGADTREAAVGAALAAVIAVLAAALRRSRGEARLSPNPVP